MGDTGVKTLADAAQQASWAGLTLAEQLGVQSVPEFVFFLGLGVVEGIALVRDPADQEGVLEGVGTEPVGEMMELVAWDVTWRVVWADVVSGVVGAWVPVVAICVVS